MKSLYISRVKIKNYRNFKDVDVKLGHKQVIIGENNVGKTNFLRALQLILDPILSDEDRMLDESDFNDLLIAPMENQAEIRIDIYISGYENNKTVLTVMQDATIINENGEEELQITYRFFPYENTNGKVEYQFAVYMANDESKRFGSYQRRYLNIKVIKALRNVESELKNSRISPIKKMLDEYSINKSELERIAEEYKKSSDRILNLDELKDLTNNINKRFSRILGNGNFDVTLQAMEIDPNRVLSSLKLLMANRSTEDNSLGINNILYISMILQMLQDKTVPTFLKADVFSELSAKPDSAILSEVYELRDSGNYFLKNEISESKESEIYLFMDKYMATNKGVTILAIEEPEAHLHPVNQRLIYKDVIKNSNNSVLLTTHSTHITAIAPIESIVNLHEKQNEGTVIYATADMPISDGEFLDVERYLDVKRGEIYLGKGVILVEGIAEEYLVPKFAELLGKPLDEKGIIVCNINSTNFTPYVKLLQSLDIPFAIITDGDFYYIDENGEKVYHTDEDDVDMDELEFGYLGLEVVKAMVNEVGLNDSTSIPDDFCEADELYRIYGIFVGNSTLEVDMMRSSKTNKEAIQVFIELFNELTEGGERQKSNFKREITSGEYWKCLRKIEGNGIGKGRFAQKLSNRIYKEHIPEYIELAIDYIYEKVNV